MRTAFVQALQEIAEQDERVFLVCGDLGFSVLEPFAQRYPKRYLNVGVAEQNMTGLAAGLAMSGKIVFTYSIANFPVMRCLEQIRNDVCYHRLDVKVVAVGGGLSYGPQGYTHHAVEDLAVMRVLPHMTVVAPSDPVETMLATRAIAQTPGPCYLRLGKAGEPVIHGVIADFVLGKAIRIRRGSDVTLISTGGVLQTVLRVADALAQKNISTTVLSMHTVQPLDTEAVLSAVRETRGIVTVEEHGAGGLASAVAEVLAEAGSRVGFRPVRLTREPAREAGSQEYLRASLGVSEGSIESAVRSLL
jgi:transketolase